MYGFEGEVKSKYNAQMAEIFTEVFNWLPLAHLINGRILVRFYFFALSRYLLRAHFSEQYSYYLRARQRKLAHSRSAIKLSLTV